MDRKEHTFYRKIEEYDGCTYRTQVTLGTRCLYLIILHEVKDDFLVYNSETILEQNLKEQAEKLGMAIDEYFEKLAHFFETPSNVRFKLENNVFSIIEDVKCHLQVKFFYCNVERADICSLGSLIDELQNRNLNSTNQYKELLDENAVLRKDVIEYKKKLNELVDRKIVDEETMLSNFVSILNEKKRRIQHLNELLEVFRNDPSLANPVDVSVNCRKKRKYRSIKREEIAPITKEEVSESDDSHYDNMTDEETKPEQAYNKYSEIFEESPDLDISQIPNLNTSVNSETVLPSTSTDLNPQPEQRPKEENKHSKDDSSDCEMMNVDTQEFLENFKI